MIRSPPGCSLLINLSLQINLPAHGESHPLERRFRDIHTVTQQLQGRMAHFETVGAWMLGGEPDLAFV